MTSKDLVQIHKAISDVSKGKDVNEDSWMVMWCNTNWGDLLQPAPLSIAVLGSLMVISSSTTDFTLSENTSIELRYIKYSDSFKTTLQQMVGEGYKAFETASKGMTDINNASGQLPEKIREAVELIIGNPSSQEVEAFLPGKLDAILKLSDICTNASQKCERAFMDIGGLAQEILECSTYRVGTAEERERRNKMHLAILDEQKKQQQGMVDKSKETFDLMKKSFTDAEKEFKTAIDKVPSGWEIMGMHVVEGLMNTITAPINALLGSSNVQGQFLQTGKSGGQGNTTQPSSQTLSDPGAALAQQILTLVTGLSHLISGGPDGKPDWDNIRESKGKSGGLYVEMSLQGMKDKLDGTKPISKELLPIAEQAADIAVNVNKKANSADVDDHALDEYKPRVEQMMKDLQVIVTRCNLILQQTGNTATGPGTPQQVPTNPSVTDTAIETAKFTVDQTRANLEAARDSYDKASERLMEGQKEIAKTIAEMTALSLENATLKEIIPVLTKAIKAFTTLRAQFSQLAQFFSNVSSLISVVMKPQVSSWVQTIEESSNLILGGVSLSNWARHMIYVQMMGPLKVSMLAEKISETYLKVSDAYIMPGQRKVGQMLQFAEDDTEEGRKKLRARLATAQAEIQQDSQTTSEQIHDLVMRDQKKFAGAINRRLETIIETVGKVLPEIKDPVPKQISDVTESHVKEVEEKRKETEEATPPYDIHDLM